MIFEDELLFSKRIGESYSALRERISILLEELKLQVPYLMSAGTRMKRDTDEDDSQEGLKVKKAKTKGKSGTCHLCHPEGHFWRECPKGKAKKGTKAGKDHKQWW